MFFYVSVIILQKPPEHLSSLWHVDFQYAIIHLNSQISIHQTNINLLRESIIVNERNFAINFSIKFLDENFIAIFFYVLKMSTN